MAPLRSDCISSSSCFGEGGIFYLFTDASRCISSKVSASLRGEIRFISKRHMHSLGHCIPS